MIRHLLAAALLLSSCRATRSEREPEGPNSLVTPGLQVAPSQQPATSSKQLKDIDVPQLAPPAPDAPRWQHRQYRRTLRAAVPRKLGKGASYQVIVGDNNQQQSAYKPRAPQGQAKDSSSLQQATAAKGAQAAAGEGNTQARTESTGLSWWWLVAAAVVAGVYWAYRLRGRLPV